MPRKFCDLPCVSGIADDIVVYGYNIDFSDEDVNLRAVFQRARETGLEPGQMEIQVHSNSCPLPHHSTLTVPSL